MNIIPLLEFKLVDTLKVICVTIITELLKKPFMQTYCVNESSNLNNTFMINKMKLFEHLKKFLSHFKTTHTRDITNHIIKYSKLKQMI